MRSYFVEEKYHYNGIKEGKILTKREAQEKGYYTEYDLYVTGFDTVEEAKQYLEENDEDYDQGNYH